MKSVFRYPGGKTRKSIQKRILAYAPINFDEYREPFVGGGGIFFAVDERGPFGQPLVKWINDIDPELMSVYLSLRDRPDEFIAICKSIKPMKAGEPEVYPTENSKGRKYNARLKSKFDELAKGEGCDQALRYFFINRTVWGGRVTYDPKMKSRLYFSNPEGWGIVNTNRLEQVARYLKVTKITIGDYTRLLKLKGKGKVWVYCFMPGSLVRREDERLVSIEDMAVGDKLWGGKQVKECLSRYYSENVFSFKVQGSPLTPRMTANHPVLRIPKRRQGSRQDIRTDGQLHSEMSLCRADQVEVGDYLCIPVGGKEVPISWECARSARAHKISFHPDDNKIGYLLGIYAAEGHTQRMYKGLHCHTVFSFGFHETDTLAKRTAEYIEDVFGVTARVAEMSPHKSVTQVRVFSFDVTQFFHKWVTGTAKHHDKQLHPDIMSAPISVQKSILRGWLLGDGGICRSRNGTKCKLTGTSASYDLALQMYRMALRCGFRPSFKKRSRNLDNSWDVYFSISDDIQELGWHTESKRCCATRRIIDGYVLSRVRDITEVAYSGKVYNLEVDGDHLLCVDNVVSHNCDPPYVKNTQLETSSQLYSCGFTEEDHVKFAEEVKESPHKICISYDDDDAGFVRSLFPKSDGFWIKDTTWSYCGTSSARSQKTKATKEKGRELIITNYEC